MTSTTLQLGDSLELSGGYFPNGPLFGPGKAVRGIVEAFIPGQNRLPATLVRLDAPLTAEGVVGSLIVLELRNTGATWEPTGHVHLELCDFQPEPLRWQDRRQGKWIESAAIYRVLTA